MSANLRNWVVGAALLIVAAAVGWTVVSRDDARQRGAERLARAPTDAVSVVVTTVDYRPFAQDMEAIGTARANEAVDITAKLSNRVTAIRFREGQQVRAGDVLIEFDSEQARANLEGAEAALKDSRSQFNRSRELYATKALSESQLDQLQATLSVNEARVAVARAQLSDTIIRAPFAGRVGLRNISVGSFVNPGDVITTLDDTSVIKLDFSVPEVFLSQLHEGMGIAGRTTAYAGEIFQGKVASIDNRLDPVSRAVMVRAAIVNRDGRLKPGMLMTVALHRAEAPVLLIPEQGLVPEGERQYVFAVRNDKAVRVEVRTGRRRPGEVEIVDGLSSGDVVIVEGTQKVRDGIAVKAIGSDVEEAGVGAAPPRSRTRA